MERETTALKNIEVALAGNDGSMIGEYLGDDRPKVRKAAEKALEKLSQTEAVNNTPEPEIPVDSSGPLLNFGNSEQDQFGNIVPPEEDRNRNPPIRPKDWVKATNKQVMEYQKQGVIVGHNPHEGTILLKEGVK